MFKNTTILNPLPNAKLPVPTIHKNESITDKSIALPLKFNPENTEYSMNVDIVWSMCVVCTIIPILSSVFSIITSPSFSNDMLKLPYDCKLFYFGIFSALPGITVHIFCLSLIFHSISASGICMAILSVFIFVVTIEHSCMTISSIGVDKLFYMLSFSIYMGLVSQIFFVSTLYHQSSQKNVYIAVISVGVVLVTLTVLSIVLSALNSEIPHTKSTVLIRVVPLSISIFIYTFSTYWTIFPVRVVCNNI